MNAEDITQQKIAAYLNSRTDLKPASLNRYRSTMSMIYAEGIRNGKVKTNPARLVRLRREDNARIPCLWFELVMGEATKKDAKLADVTWHVLRHTYISRLVMAGVDLRTVAELAGHKTLSMTMRYAHLAPEHKQDAMRKLSDYRKKNSSVRKSTQVV